MPLTRIAAPEHLPLSQLQALAGAAQAALVETCGVPINDVFHLITRFKPGEMMLDPSFGGVQRSRDACIVEILFLQGRTDDQKRRLYQVTVAGAVAAGFRPDDVMIALMENARIDWSLGHGLAYVDVAESQKHTALAGAAAGKT